MKHKRGIKATIGLAILALLLLFSNLTALAVDPTWIQKEGMNDARQRFQTAVVNGKIYAIGGLNNISTLLSSTDAYDPASNTWTRCAAMHTARANFRTQVIGGKIYAFGGMVGTNSFASTIESYDPATNTWTVVSSMATYGGAFQSEVIDGKIYVIGGLANANTIQASMQRFDPSTNTWTSLASMSTPRAYFQTAVIGGKIYAFGGHNGTNIVSSAEVYDPSTNAWSPLPAMSATRYQFQSAVVGGKIYAFGGIGKEQNASGNSTLYSSEVYDPSTNTWSSTGNMSINRYNFAAKAIGSQIYVIGGYSTSTCTSSTEVYDTVSNTWTSLANLSTARQDLQVATSDGILYAIGGTTANTQYTYNNVEAYTVATPPAAPTLTATAGDAQVALSWNTVADATGYNVYRSTTSGGPYTQIAAGIIGTTYTDTGLTNGTTYYYVVTAANAAGESVYSNEVSATPQASWNGLLNITMTTGEHKEYALTASQINAFIAWYNGGGSGSPTYMFDKTFNKGTLSSRKDYVAFSKIAFFEVMAYQPNGTPPTPTGTKTALLRVTMSTGDIMEYEVTDSQLTSFTSWYGGGGTSSPAFAVSKEFNLGPFISRTDYLVYDKIVDFEVLEY